MKPIIGITTFDGVNEGFHSVNSTYINAVFTAGGIPVTIPIIHKEEDYHRYIDILDGIIFSGGLDISPLTYNENPLREVEYISATRDKYEMGLFKAAYERRLPIIGICRGLQLTNVVLGGSLYQDLGKQVPNVLGHSPKFAISNQKYHSIKIEDGTLMKEIFGQEEIFVNSLHHQAIKDLGENLKASSYSEDGLIESIEATDNRFLLGLQFHPEALVPNFPEFVGVFEKLLEASKDENLKKLR